MIVLHNTMEDLVISYLEEILDSKKGICKCDFCKTDMAAYALNRVRPMYVVSSRGVVHTENFKRKRIQEEIDVYALVAEAVDVVSNMKRHDVDHKASNITRDNCYEIFKKFKEGGVYFNFPQIVGRVLDASTIKFISGAKVTLYYENGSKVVPMCNTRWENPLYILPQMEGTFTFWPVPVETKKENIQKDFYFNILVEKDNFSSVRKYFYLRSVSRPLFRKTIGKEDTFYLDDIYLSLKES